MTPKRSKVLLAAATLVAATGACAQQPQPAESRGRLLYETHCIACHTTQVHWRDKRQATDWSGLKSWVARWQANLGLNWTELDVTEVARHLNDLYYRFRQTGNVVGSATMPQNR